MTEIGFYQLTRTSLEDALPRLLQRILGRGWWCIVRATSSERLAMLDRHLWTFDRSTFLPHGVKPEGMSAHQPIWLTTDLERPNQAQALILVDAASLEDAHAFERVLDIFDGRDEACVRTARERWRRCREWGHTLRFWQQNERGGWELASEVVAKTAEAAALSAPTEPSVDGEPRL